MDKLSDEEILNYLMTSEFNEGLTQEEFLFLLKKYRYFYRLISGRNGLISNEIEYLKKVKDAEELVYKSQITEVTSERDVLLRTIEKLKRRNLSWKERFLGKIIQNNEN